MCARLCSHVCASASGGSLCQNKPLTVVVTDPCFQCGNLCLRKFMLVQSCVHVCVLTEGLHVGVRTGSASRGTVRGEARERRMREGEATGEGSHSWRIAWQKTPR